jgi:hypothetical protein
MHCSHVPLTGVATATDTAALLHERDAVLEQLEAARSQNVSERLIVVDREGNDTGLQVRRVSVKELHEQRKRKVRRLTDELELIERELRNRGFE